MMPHQITQGCKSLVATQLDTRVSEQLLYDIFSSFAVVERVAVENDDTPARQKRGIIDFADHFTAEQILHSMSGKPLLGQAIALNWAPVKQSPHLFSVYIDGISADTDEVMLAQPFERFEGMCGAHVLYNEEDGKATGVGRVDFQDEYIAKDAMITVDGATINGSTVHCRWFAPHRRSSTSSSDSEPGRRIRCYDKIFNKAPLFETTVRISIPENKKLTKQDLMPAFQQYGYVSQVRLAMDGRSALVSMDTHANAAKAIFELEGHEAHGYTMHLQWPRDSDSTAYEPVHTPPSSASLNFMDTRHEAQIPPMSTGFHHHHRPPVQMSGWGEFYHPTGASL